ncbi:MAG: hypothetical protein WAT79_08740 [Saprospiraceae bacterium]
MGIVQIIAVVLLSLILVYLLWDAIDRKKKYYRWVEYMNQPIQVGDTVVHKTVENIKWVVIDIGEEKIKCNRYSLSHGSIIGNFSILELYKV